MKTHLMFLFLVILLIYLIPFGKSQYYDGDEGRIPKIIHQTAMSDKSKWHPVWEKCQKTWIENFPDYEYMMWTDEDSEEFIRDEYPWFYKTYMGYDRNIKRIDAIRYFILYHYGGIYADMDFECLKNFEHLLPVGKVCAAPGPSPEFIEKYQNAMIASPKHHDFWPRAWEYLEENKDEKNVIKATGPLLINTLAEKYPELFHPLDKNFTEQHTIFHNPFIKLEDRGKITEDTYVKHYESGTWGRGFSEEGAIMSIGFLQ